MFCEKGGINNREQKKCLILCSRTIKSHLTQGTVEYQHDRKRELLKGGRKTDKRGRKEY